MTEVCKECGGTGQVKIILKARSVGITTWACPAGTKVTCPDCKGLKTAWWLKSAGV